MAQNKAERDWARRAKKLLLEGDGTISIPTYTHYEVFGEYGVYGRLYARCPFCHELNHDEHILLGKTYNKRSLPEGACQHFVKMIGGCGAYDFVFKQEE